MPLKFTRNGLLRYGSDNDESVKAAIEKSDINHKKLTKAVTKVKYSPYTPPEDYAAELIAAYEGEE